MPIPADIFVMDDSISPAPISGVFVSVLDPSTFAVVATATTDVSGRAAFSLPGSALGTPYESRFYKLGVTFKNPKQISVQDPVVTTNKFDVSGTLIGLPAATDPVLCRCTGRFMSLSNSPIAGVTVRFMAKAESGFQWPKVVNGNLVSAEVLATKTDADGFLTVDLYRGMECFITFSGEDDTVWNIKVPDRSSANLIELIHPQPVLLNWDPTLAPGNAVTVAVGQTLLIPYSVVFSDYEELTEGTLRWFKFINSDDATIGVGSSDGVVSVQGVAAGVANVTIEMLPNLKPVRVPAYAVTAPALVVTVIP